MNRPLMGVVAIICGALFVSPMQTRAATGIASPTGTEPDAAADAQEGAIIPQPVATPPPRDSLTVDGSVTLVSDYRYRGRSYTNNRPAVQASATISHRSGFYVATFLSTLAGDGSYGGDDLEADILAGYTRPIDKIVLDAGVWNYRFPGTRRTDFVELYGALTIPVRRASVKIGYYYAPPQHSIGGRDDLSSYAEISVPLTNTLVTLKTHAGYTVGKGSTLAGPSGRYVDCSIGADVQWHALTLNVSYVDTTINRAQADRYYAVGGRRVIAGAVIASIAKTF